MTGLFFGLTLAFLLIGIPIAITVGLSSIIYILLQGIQFEIIVQRLFAGVDVAALLAIPFFILAGDLMNRGGIAKRLVKMANSAVGNTTGGLAIVTILTCMFFAAISGSGVATAAAIGSIMIPAMVSEKYDKGFAAAVVASASPIGVIIPPSISFILYGVLTGTSISDLYKAGIPAGIIMGMALMITSYAISKKRGYKGVSQLSDNRTESFTENTVTQSKEKVTSKEIVEVLWALGTPVIIVGGVFGGFFTPTESAVVAVVYALLVGLFVYKEIKIEDLPKVFLSSGISAARIMFIIANATLFAWVLAYERIPQQILQTLLAISDSKIVLLLIINIILLIAGTFMETGSILLIAVPLLLPIINQLGINLVHFGIIITVNTAIGLLTPPFGVCLFTSANVSGISVQALSKKVLIFIVAMIAALMIITYIPASVMFLV